MRWQLGWRVLTGLTMLSALLVFGVSGAFGDDFHGIAFTKGCTSPTKVGSPYTCAYQILNVVDTAHDTLKITGLTDQVNSAGGPVASGNILGALELVFSGGVTCNGGSGAGTNASPYVGATDCTLPFGSFITTNAHSFYTVQAADFGLPQHRLTDTATLNWNNTCTAPSPNCTTGAQQISAGSSSLVQQLTTTTATNIHDGQHQVVTAVRKGTTVHDFVTVTGQPGAPVPTGNVTIDWFTNGTCTGTPAANSGSVGPLDASGHFDATGFAFTPGTGHFAFEAHYLGDATYTASDGACEPLTVVDARIHITPDATNEVSHLHTFTVHVEKNLGDGWVDASGEHVDFTLTNANGASATLSAGASTCDDPGPNTDATGTCTIVFLSPTAGQVTGHATSTLTLDGVPVTVATDGQGENGPNATKTFVDAYINIAPPLATNPVGVNHVFTATVFVNDGLGAGYVLAPNGTTVTFAYVGPHVGTITSTNPCTTTGGSCSVTTTSTVAGLDTMSATTTVLVGSTPGGPVALTRTTGTAAPAHDNSDNAVKQWADDTVHTDIHNANHVVVTNVAPGTSVHDNVQVARDPATPAAVPNPTGSVVFHRYANTTCTGESVDQTVQLTQGDPSTAESASVVANAGLSYKADYSGDANYPAHTGACEPLQVVDARITIAPSGTNEIGHAHTFTVFVEKNDGTGWSPAAGVAITSTTDFGSITGGTCGPTGPTDVTGKCTVIVNSPTPGTATVNASGTVNVGGVSIDVATNGYGAHDISNQKTWVDAKISITPLTAINPVGAQHTFTGHVDVNPGTGWVNAPDGTQISFTIDSGPGTLGAPNPCTTAGGTGSCTITLNSATTGTTVVGAHTTVSVGGVSLTRNTDGSAGNSAPATKLWADDSVRTDIHDASHNVVTSVLTGTSVHDKAFVTRAAGTPASVPDPTGTVTFRLYSNKSCTFTGEVPPAGQTVPLGADGTAESSSTTATSDLSYQATYSGDSNYPSHVGACEPLTVTTPPPPPPPPPPVVLVSDANISITPLTAINPVGKNHTLTAHVNVNTGNGFGNAPNGTVITFTITNTGGANSTFVGPSTCTTAGGTGSCSVVIVSSTTGTTTVKAATDVSVNGTTLHRETDASGSNSGPATKLWADSTVRTDILNASGAVVTTVQAGTVVHDKVFVDRAAGTPASVPNPTGTVVFHRFATSDCTGASTDQSVALTPGSPSTAVSDDFAPTGNISYRADYSGDANYPAHSGACEPLIVTPIPHPAIAIVKNPKSQTVAKGGTARFTITVTNVGDVTLTNVHVTDRLSPNCNRTQADIPALASMAPGASVTYSCTRPNVQANFTNVAVAIGTPPTGPDVTATDSAPVKTAVLKPPPKKVVKKKKKPKVVSHKKPKATG